MTNITTERFHDSERYEPCAVCGDEIDTHAPGYYKSADEVFRHAICHEQDSPPAGYVHEVTGGDKVCTTRTYNCGHSVYMPPADAPQFCPACNDIVLEDSDQ